MLLGLRVTGFHHFAPSCKEVQTNDPLSWYDQSARIAYLSKSDEIGTEAKLDEIEGQK
jgi:hypothetical protein